MQMTENSYLNSGIVVTKQVDQRKIYLTQMVGTKFISVACLLESWVRRAGGVVIRLFSHIDGFSLTDGNEVVNNLTKSKLQSRLGVNEKLALLQRAEENFYQNENTNKQVYLR